MNKQKGFTIIELIVVIAIIAVLAGIVLVNVTSYINKGKDVSAKGNLTSLVTNGAVYFDTPTSATPAGGGGTYSGWITGTGTGAALYTTIYTALTSTNMNYAVTANCDVAACGANSAKWCALVPLKAGATGAKFCVDSSGNKVESTTTTCSAGVCGS